MVASSGSGTPATPVRSGIPAPRASTSSPLNASTPSPAARLAARPRIPQRSSARPGPTGSNGTSDASANAGLSSQTSQMKSSSSMRKLPSLSRLAQPSTPVRSREVPAVPSAANDGRPRTSSSSSRREAKETTAGSQHTPSRQPLDVPQEVAMEASVSSSKDQDLEVTDEAEELRSQLRRMEVRYRILQVEHSRCPLRSERTGSRSSDVDDKLLDLLNDREALTSVVRGMPKAQRTGLLSVIAEACRPSDLQAQIDLLELYKESRTGVLGRLDDDLCEQVIRLLDPKEILSIRLVAKRFDPIATRPSVWKALCQDLESAWDGTIDLTNYKLQDEGDWFGLYKRLWQREKQWTNGQVQSLVVLPGHTNYVTSLKLVGETLISGSYDDTIRIWNLPYAVASATAVPPPQVISAKSISSIDYYAPEGVLVTGSHDVGRASVWRQVEGEWKVERILSGHLHGTRAVAINAQWLVSVGSDKAIVVWDWRTGNKVVRFGQQTNVCVGMRLLDNFIISATVDGVIRSFSIAKREMLGQFRLSDLAARQPEYAAKLKDVGVGALGMLTWFEAEGRFMACATKDIVIRLAWDWVSPDDQFDTSDGAVDQSVLSPAQSTPVRPRMSGNGVSPASRSDSPRGGSPLHSRASPAHKMSPSVGSKLSHMMTNTSEEDMPSTTTGTTSRFALHMRPRIVEILDITGTERGAFEAGRVRIVTSRRLSAKSGAERRVIVGTERTSESGKPTMQLVPLGGKWDTAGLQSASKNPMSLALDHDKLVYGCSDGSIVVAGFVGLGTASPA